MVTTRVKASLAVGAHSDLVILRPNATTLLDRSTQDKVAHDAVLEGRLRIQMPAATAFRKIRVELVNRGSVLALARDLR